MVPRRIAFPPLLPACLLLLLVGAGCATKGDVAAVDQKVAALADDNKKMASTLATNVDRKLDELQARVAAEAKKSGDGDAALTDALQQVRTELLAATQRVDSVDRRLTELREMYDREVGALRGELAAAQESLARVSSESASSAAKVAEVAEENRRQIATVSRELGAKIGGSVEQITELRGRIARLEESIADVLVRIRATILYQQNAMKDQAASIARSIRDYDDTLSTFDDLFPEVGPAGEGAGSPVPASSAATGSPGQ